jgi:branched-chain amino acid transport system permease protein
VADRHYLMSGFDSFLQFLLSGITIGSLYALTAIGFTVIYNCTQVVNFAQGEFVMLGAMIAAVLVNHGHVPLWAACVIAVVAVTIVGGLTAGSILRPLRTGTVVTLIIITVGASILFRGVAMLLWGKEAIRLPPEYKDHFIRIGQASINLQSVWVMLTTVVLVILLWLFYKYTMIGRAMRACASCKPGAKLVGININRMTIMSFALGAGVGALGGVVIFPIPGASYDMGTMYGMKGFCAAILGGLGNFTGGIIAGVTLGVLESMATGYAPSGYGGYKDAIAFIILLIILFVRPQGVFGGKKG